MKFVLGIALALGLAAVAYGAAATLIVSGGALQQNTVSVSCDATGVEVGYTVVDGVVVSAEVTDLADSTCEGADLSVELLNPAGAGTVDCEGEEENLTAGEIAGDTVSVALAVAAPDNDCSALNALSVRVTIATEIP